MSDAPDPKDVLRRFFATLSTGDYTAIGEFFGDDSVWMVNNVVQGNPGQRGRQKIIDDFLQPVRDGLFEPGDPKVEVVRMISEGDWVAAETIAKGSLRNGNTYENYYAWVAQIDGEQVKFLKEYMDTSYAFEISKPNPDQESADGHVAEQLRRLGHEA
jgi:ketosteroid isomerase-like protein